MYSNLDAVNFPWDTNRSNFAQICPVLKKRRIEIAVISNIHLGSAHCQAGALLAYLNSISPRVLVLSGAFLDKHPDAVSSFPREHFSILKKIFGMAAMGTKIYYIYGHHDRALKTIRDQSMGDLHLTTNLILELDGKKAWFTQGEFLDSPLLRRKWAQRLGPGLQFSLACWLRFQSRVRGSAARQVPDQHALQPPPPENSVPDSCNSMREAAKLAAARGCEYIICGTPHRARNEWFESRYGKCQFLSPGDWAHNLTALEYNFKRWKPYHYREDKLSPFFADEDVKEMDMEELLSKNERERSPMA